MWWRRLAARPRPSPRPLRTPSWSSTSLTSSRNTTRLLQARLSEFSASSFSSTTSLFKLVSSLPPWSSREAPSPLCIPTSSSSYISKCSSVSCPLFFSGFLCVISFFSLFSELFRYALSESNRSEQGVCWTVQWAKAMKLSLFSSGDKWLAAQEHNSRESRITFKNERYCKDNRGFPLRKDYKRVWLIPLFGYLYPLRLERNGQSSSRPAVMHHACVRHWYVGACLLSNFLL